MANARKCDRCGTCFDPMGQGYSLMARFRNPFFQSSEDLKENTAGAYLISDNPDAFVDLCPECTGNFQLFMGGYPLAVEKGYFDKADKDDTENEAPPESDEEEKEYEKTAFQRFLDRVDALGDEFFSDLEGYGKSCQENRPSDTHEKHGL